MIPLASIMLGTDALTERLAVTWKQAADDLGDYDYADLFVPEIGYVRLVSYRETPHDTLLLGDENVVPRLGRLLNGLNIRDGEVEDVAEGADLDGFDATWPDGVSRIRMAALWVALYLFAAGVVAAGILLVSD